MGRPTDSGLAGSIGYKATYDGNTGFVTAGHVIDFFNVGNTSMEQPVNGDIIGTELISDSSRSAGDYAFVKTTTGIDDDIFLNGNDTYEVTSSATVTEHTGGKFLYKMSAVTGLQYGNIDGSLPSAGMITTTIPVSTGDSGGVVFQVTSGTNVKIFGHLTEDHSGAWYTRVDHLIREVGISPST